MTSAEASLEAEARALHRTAYVADAHADALLWNRDLRTRQRRGHVDFVRLGEAGVRLQVFTVVSRGFPFIGGFPALALAHGWPLEAVRSPWTRALFQINRLTRACESGAAVLARAPADLAPGPEGRVACVLGIEGGHAIEGRVERVGELARRGVAFMGLTHLVPNELGGSSFPFRGRRGLTALGARVLEAMAAHGLAVDVAHASRRLLAALLEQEEARIFCSHTGVAALGPRGGTSTTMPSAASPSAAASWASSSGRPTSAAAASRRWPTTSSTRSASPARRRSASGATSTGWSRFRPG